MSLGFRYAEALAPSPVLFTRSAQRPCREPRRYRGEFRFAIDQSTIGNWQSPQSAIDKMPRRRRNRAMNQVPAATARKDSGQLSFDFENRAVMSAARAAEIVAQAAHECRPGQVRSVRVRFRPFRATLYSFRITAAGDADIKFHAVFQRASEEVLSQAAQLMFTRTRRNRRAVPRAAYDAFVRAMAPGDFNLPGARRSTRKASREPGRHHSLPASFQRVNAEYFNTTLQAPELCWSPARARRILGSYQHRTDRLIISRVFDAPQIPVFVLDYLMYHELLHKFLGIGSRRDGKRRLHGAEFRKHERRFAHYKEARQFLTKL